MERGGFVVGTYGVFLCEVVGFVVVGGLRFSSRGAIGD